MSKKQDLEDFDRFMGWLKYNPDVKKMIADTLTEAMTKKANNPYIHNPRTTKENKDEQRN